MAMPWLNHSLLLLATAVLILLPTGCEKAQSDNETKTEAATAEESHEDEKPLLLDDEHPLLLDDPAAGLADANMADNSRCFVCHLNYAQEKIAVTHAKQDIGCNHCHGESDEHIADESWASGGAGTAPDKIYTKAQVNPFCLGCHSSDKLSEEPHKPVFADSTPPKHCTDCHGEHLLKERKTKWK